MPRSSTAVLLLLAAAVSLLVGGELWLRDSDERGDGEPAAPPAEESTSPTLPPGNDRRSDPPYEGRNRVHVEGLVLDSYTGEPIVGARVRSEADAGRWETRTAAGPSFIIA